MTKAEKHKIYMRGVWYPRNRAKHIARVKETKDRRKKEVLGIVRSIRVRCLRCGENHPAVLDFHHRDPSKKSLGIAKMVCLGYSVKRIKFEIEKCDVLCSNCHRKEHFYRSVEF